MSSTMSPDFAQYFTESLQYLAVHATNSHSASVIVPVLITVVILGIIAGLLLLSKRFHNRVILEEQQQMEAVPIISEQPLEQTNDNVVFFDLQKTKY